MNFNPAIFREYDIRGIYKKEFDKSFCEALGFSFIKFLEKELSGKNIRISLGKDTRESCNEIEGALVSGFLKAGADVTKIGLVTTPISYFSLEALDVQASCMITASHNPREFNGFKFSIKNSHFFGRKIQELLDCLTQPQLEAPLLGAVKTKNIFPDYIQSYKEEFDFKNSRLKVVLDCGNGTAGVVARKLYTTLGLKPQILFEKPDGHCPSHHPDPSIEKNLEDLKKAVLHESADIGIGFDEDCDRLGVVDDNGEFLAMDRLITLLGLFVLKEHPHSKIIADVKCSQVLFDTIKGAGGQPIMWKTGHSFIKQKVKDEGAFLGGELSGHVFFSDKRVVSDDALYVGLRVLKVLQKEKKSLSHLMKSVPKAFNTPEIRIPTTEERKKEVVESVIEGVQKSHDLESACFLDGVRVHFKTGGWALIRVSNTQPMLVLRLEAPDRQLLKHIKDYVAELLPEEFHPFLYQTSTF